MLVDVLASSLLPLITQCYMCHLHLNSCSLWRVWDKSAIRNKKNRSIILWIDSLPYCCDTAADQDPTVAGAVEEKGDVCPSQTSLSDRTNEWMWTGREAPGHMSHSESEGCSKTTARHLRILLT